MMFVQKDGLLHIKIWSFFCFDFCLFDFWWVEEGKVA